MSGKVDVTGRRYGRLTVLEDVGRKDGAVVWKCQCDCGAIVRVESRVLPQNKSCGRCVHFLPLDISDVDLAWACGFFDGEGSVSVQVARSKRVRTTVVFTLKVQVTNTDIRSLERLVSIFQCGRIYAHGPIVGRRETFSWCVGARQAEAVLRLLMKYSVIKAEQIELALQFRQLRQSKPWSKRTKKDLEQALGIVTMMRGLSGNHRCKGSFKILMQEIGQEV